MIIVATCRRCDSSGVVGEAHPRGQGAADDPLVAQAAGGLGAAGVRRAVRADPKDFKGQAVVEAAADGATGDGDPDDLAGAVRSAHGELPADRGQVMPVVLHDERVGVSEMKWDCQHAVYRQPVCGSVALSGDQVSASKT